MAANLTGRAEVTFAANGQLPVNGQDVAYNFVTALALLYGYGTGDGNIQAAFLKKDKAITQGTTDTYDISGVVTGQFGETISMAKVAAIALINKSTAAAILYLGGVSGQVPFCGAATDKVKVSKGGFAALGATLDASKYIVTNSTGDKVSVECAAGSGLDGIYDLVVLGNLT